MSEQLIPEKPIIAPSMLKCDFGNLEEEIRNLEQAGATILHLDVMDGHFVPNLSYGPMVIARLRERTELVLDAHLMVSNPEQYLDDYLKAGCDWITVHIEAVSEPQVLLKRVRDAGKLAGIAINPKTPVSQIEHLRGFVDLVLVMSVEPGFGGQAFMPESIPKVEEVRRIFGEGVLVSIDGGIGPNTISDVARAGVDVYVAGSSIFDQPCYETAIREMADLARQHSHSS